MLKADADAQTVQTLAAHLGCPPAIARILVARGIDTPAAAEAFLNPTLEALLDDPACDPTQMLGMNAAVERILRAVQSAEPILIYGDYDVDGTTATALLKTTIERIGLAIEPQKPTQVTYHLPHRIREGYGMQNAILGEAAEAGVRLVISVDTGIRAIAEAVEARALSLDLIVTDHHPPDGATIPDALAVVNPTQPGCPYPNKNLCGAAVAFKLAQALLDAAAPLTPDPAAFRARTRGVLLPSFLKLVAIATVADSVPLTGENRTIAALGLAALANPVQSGLRALMQLAKIPLNRAPTATEVGFRLAPRINAAGRMDIADDVVSSSSTVSIRNAAPPRRARSMPSTANCLPCATPMASTRASASSSTIPSGIAACWAFWPRAWWSARGGPHLSSPTPTATRTARAAPSPASTCSTPSHTQTGPRTPRTQPHRSSTVSEATPTRSASRLPPSGYRCCARA
jgi:single-stranded-DNA-specific exonuclease